MNNNFVYTHKGLTKADDKVIIDCMKKHIDMTLDDVGRVWAEGGIYIADVEYAGEGLGVACR